MARGLQLNEARTRVVNLRQEGINILGFNPTWRQSRQGRGYLHVAPGSKSQSALRASLGAILNHSTLWQPTRTLVEKTNRALRGWAAYSTPRCVRASRSVPTT